MVSHSSEGEDPPDPEQSAMFQLARQRDAFSYPKHSSILFLLLWPWPGREDGLTKKEPAEAGSMMIRGLQAAFLAFCETALVAGFFLVDRAFSLAASSWLTLRAMVSV
jgi:hypothetical protein